MFTAPPAPRAIPLSLEPTPHALPPTSMRDILLEHNVQTLHAALSSAPTGLLITGADKSTRRALLQTALPTAVIESCCAYATGSTAPALALVRDLICLDDVDAPGRAVEAALKGVFARRAHACTVVGLAGSPLAVPRSLLRAGRFEKVCRVRTPARRASEEAWRRLLAAVVAVEPGFQFGGSAPRELASMSPGYGLSDFASILVAFLSLEGGNSAGGTGWRQGRGGRLSYEALQAMVVAHRPLGGSSDLDFVSAGRNGGDVQHGDGDVWDGFGGYASIKQKLIRLCEWPVKHADTFQRLGIQPPRGLLLHGAHGCGKTMLAMAFLKQLRHTNSLHVNAPDLFSKYLGDSEARVRMLFERARDLAPCVVFIDELDVIGSNRQADDSNGGGTGVERRVIGSLLTELDGVTGGDVFVLACVSSLEAMDAALVRPGRLDHVVEVGRPDEEDRKQILEHLLRAMPIHDVCRDSGRKVEKNEIVRRLVEQTSGMTGADLNAVCREAVMVAMDEEDEPLFVGHDQFAKALATVRQRRHGL